MDNNSRTLNPIITILTLSGALPFALFDTVIFTSHLASLSSFQIYALVILSFIAGSHWGFSITSENSTQFSIVSNILALGVVFCAIFNLLSEPAVIAFLLGALLIDLKLKQHSLISSQYLKLRIKITVLVILILTSRILL